MSHKKPEEEKKAHYKEYYRLYNIKNGERIKGVKKNHYLKNRERILKHNRDRDFYRKILPLPYYETVNLPLFELLYEPL